MNIEKFVKIISVFFITFSLSSCAQEVDETSDEIQNKILTAYINQHYPDAKPSASGLYIVDSIPGKGIKPTSEQYVKVDYTITYLDGSYVEYTTDSIAKQLGEYNITGYYKPVIWYMKNTSPGLVEILSQMKVGGYSKAIIPAVLLDQESGNEIYASDGSTKIYDITLHDVINDIDATQIDELEVFSKKFNNVDSTKYGLYIKRLYENPTDSVKNGESIYVKYIGRYLDGRLFDTNIPDTAKKHRIYNRNKEYELLEYKHYDNLDEAIEKNSFVQGFTHTLWTMNYGEHAHSFFYYKLGYGAEGSGQIPGYIPLSFEIWTQKGKDE